MKRTFLVPAAAAIAALSSSANAALTDNKPAVTPPADKVGQNEALAVKRALVEQSGKSMTTYQSGGDIFGFVLDTNARGEVVADHYSHSSHASHASHASSSQ